MAIDKNSILAFVKLELGISDGSDEEILIERYIDKAYDDIKLYCNNDFEYYDEEEEEIIDTYPPEMDSVIEDLVIYRWRNRGTEGKVSEQDGDYSYTKANKGGLPKFVRDRVTEYKKVRFY